MYKEATVVAGKPSVHQRAVIPCHLVDLISLSEVFTVGQFLGSSRALIKDIGTRDKVPIVMGCGAHYIHMLLRGSVRIPEPDPAALHQV